MSQRWVGTTYGNSRMHRWLIGMLRVIDVRVIYVIADVFVIPVCLAVNPSRRTSYFYFRTILGYGTLRASWSVYANHCMFARIVIDKFAMYAGRKFDVEVEGFGDFNRLAEREEGFLMMSSHIGNYEIAGYSLVSDRKSINAVVYASEKQSVMENRSSMFSRTNVRMISLRQDMSHLFEINSALSNGDIVSFPTDRFMGDARYVEREFLGRTARFPQGPFSVAAMRGIDVLAVNVMKESARRYRIFVTPLEYDRDASRSEQIRQLSGAYVGELEKRVKAYPLQWFNFYDFWN